MLIDFEQKFRGYLKEYEEQTNIEDDELDDLAPELYLQWQRMPQPWLSGKAPNTYFSSESAAGLVETLGKYILSGMSVPGVLLNRIADTKDETYPFLVRLLTDYEGEKEDALKIAVIRLIEEMDLPHPYPYYLSVIENSAEKNDVAEACADELKNSGGTLIEDIFISLDSAPNTYVADCLLDVLCDLPYDPRTFQYAMDKFLHGEQNKAFYASCLGKIGNEKALPFLEEALHSENVTYYDYTAIKYALEALGGEINIDRDFSGDRDYESLIDLEE